MPGLCSVLRGLTRILCTFLQDRSFAVLPVVTCRLVELKDEKYEVRVIVVCVRRERCGESRCSAGPVCWRGVRWRRAVHGVVSASFLREAHRSAV